MSIFLTSDWHIFKCQEGRKPSVNLELIEQLKAQIEKLDIMDHLYFLGDLMDDTVHPSGSLLEILMDIGNLLIMASPRCHFIRGNNDIMSDAFYKDLGFNTVSFAEWVENSKGEKILLSHTSVKIPVNRDIYNVHGHIHRPGTDPDKIAYYHKCDRNVNLCTVDHREHRFTNLDDINLQKESKRNNLYVIGCSEKPGMSSLCQNMATQVLNKEIYR